MEKNRIVVELFLERPNFKEVSSVAKTLESAGIKTILMPPEEREMNTHLVVEKSDLPKVRELVKKKGINAIEKEVIIITMENKPGTLADAVSKV